MTNFGSNGDEGKRPDPIRDMLRTHIDEQRNFNSEQRDFNKKIERVHNVVFGDQDAKIDGVVTKIKRVEKYISFDKKMKYTAAGMAAVKGRGWGFLDTIKHLLGIK